MKKIIATAALLLLGLPQIARADDCGGRFLGIFSVADVAGGKDPGYLFLYHNDKLNRFCSQMTLGDRREGKPTDGSLRYDICAAGFNATGGCKGLYSTGADTDSGTRQAWGPIRVGDQSGCIKAVGILSYYNKQEGANHSAVGHSGWYCNGERYTGPQPD